MNDLTPVQQADGVWLKRDDLFEVAGQRGGKARTCHRILTREGLPPGCVTAGSRHSPQVEIVANIAHSLHVPCHAHVPAGEWTPELRSAALAGADVIGHRPGHNSVIVARARSDAKALGWREVPFGMECWDAVQATATQTQHIPDGVQRVVVPVGSGMTLAGVLHGLAMHQRGRPLPVLGVVVGADPVRRLDTYASMWRFLDTHLVKSRHPYGMRLTDIRVGGVLLDPVYEAKCVEHLQPGDMLWCVGIRETA